MPDRNGYAESILQKEESRCFLCGANGSSDPLNRHEVFGGANRQKSKYLGLWVSLCHTRCHQGPCGVHSDAEKAQRLKQYAERTARKWYGWSKADFIRIFGRSYEEDGIDEQCKPDGEHWQRY